MEPENVQDVIWLKLERPVAVAYGSRSNQAIRQGSLLPRTRYTRPSGKYREEITVLYAM